jgi:hypothetical protein
LCPPTDADRKELRAYSHIGGDAMRLSMMQRRKSTVAVDAKTRAVSHYEEIIHPNFEEDPEETMRMSMLEAAGD